MRINTTALALLLTIGITGSVCAGEIYKWVDENGNAHYGDRPSGSESEQLVSLKSHRTDPQMVQARVQSRLDQQTAREAALAAQPQGPSDEELRAEKREREEKCSTYRARLERFVHSRRLYREDEAGERVYLDEEETLAARERVQNQVEEYCTS